MNYKQSVSLRLPIQFFLKGMGANQVIEFAIQLERTLKNLGYDYISLGPALPDFPESYGLIPDLIEFDREHFLFRVDDRSRTGSIPSGRKKLC